jgi:hypothetical protein
MAQPLNSAKQTVDLAAPAVRGSRIRREPPARVKEIPIRDREERERLMVIAGVVLFACALVALLVGIASAAGWSPSAYDVHIELD